MTSTNGGFILSTKLTITDAAKAQLLVQLLARKRSELVDGLAYVNSYEEYDENLKVTKVLRRTFRLFSYHRAEVPKDCIVEIGGRPFVFQDGRWADDDCLVLDFDISGFLVLGPAA